LAQLLQQWTGAYQPVTDISLSPLSLPKYTFLSMMRGLIGYVISLLFTLIYAFWAAKDERAEKLLIPILDILQSVPVLAFMPGLVITLATLFHRSNFGLELAAIIMIFTGQAWNMTLSLYYSFKSVPPDLQEVGTVYRFNWWERLKWIELPCGTTGLVWNSMMSMAGGWFFLVITETFRLGDKDFRLPGIGSYMSVATEKWDILAMLYAMIAMIAMIVFLDQTIWRPVTVWAQRFRIDEISQAHPPTSWLLKLLRHSRLIRWIEAKLARQKRMRYQQERKAKQPIFNHKQIQKIQRYIANIAFSALLALVVIAIIKIFTYLIYSPTKINWCELTKAGGRTLVRVLLSTMIGTLWALPAGLAIGLSTRLSRIFQPIVQIAASFPAPILFPLIIATLIKFNIGYNSGCILLMLLGTQWYILFNVIAGAMAIPNDLREVATSFNFSRWQRLKSLYLPAIFSYLLTGWVTASGGAWNASIIAEYYNTGTMAFKPSGLGTIISSAAYNGDYTTLVAGTLLMSIIVIAFNKLVWKPCYALACTRYSMDK
jgi:NitT/TauT family transport system permease protein